MFLLATIFERSSTYKSVVLSVVNNAYFYSKRAKGNVSLHISMSPAHKFTIRQPRNREE